MTKIWMSFSISVCSHAPWTEYFFIFNMISFIITYIIRYLYIFLYLKDES